MVDITEYRRVYQLMMSSRKSKYSTRDLPLEAYQMMVNPSRPLDDFSKAADLNAGCVSLGEEILYVVICSPGGVGYALALEFAARNLRVFATTRSAQVLSKLEEKGIEAFQLDVTKMESIIAARDEISKRAGGRLDILFNNAGIMYEALAIEADAVRIRNMFDTNVFGLFDMVSAFTPLLLAAHVDKQTPPLIVNTSSILARVPYPFAAAYNASKACFHSVLKKVKARTETHLEKSVKPEKFAKEVVQEVLDKHPRLGEGEYVWKGSKASLIWFLNAVGWRKVFDAVVKGMVGLDQQQVQKTIFQTGHASVN